MYVSLSVILLIATFTNDQRPNKKKKKKKEKMQNEWISKENDGTTRS